MKTTKMALRLSIFVGEGDIWHHKPTYVEIVHRAHHAGLAGASVLRGVEGYGATSRIHTQHAFRLSDDLPLLIVIVDSAEKVRSFLSQLDDLGLSGPVVVDEAEMIRYAEPAPRQSHWWSASQSGPG
ncbi:DUF190 domain-containing protein [Amycolatopsis ultiminotia]|uniref:DUF190 domain-containing protein n=1 Tax=Amycolatopsis ultiminotia TaxID=543629 RepID=A0ABP6XNH9_9PSEU